MTVQFPIRNIALRGLFLLAALLLSTAGRCDDTRQINEQVGDNPLLRQDFSILDANSPPPNGNFSKGFVVCMDKQILLKIANDPEADTVKWESGGPGDDGKISFLDEKDERQDKIDKGVLPFHSVRIVGTKVGKVTIKATYKDNTTATATVIVTDVPGTLIVSSLNETPARPITIDTPAPQIIGLKSSPTGDASGSVSGSLTGANGSVGGQLLYTSDSANVKFSSGAGKFQFASIIVNSTDRVFVWNSKIELAKIKVTPLGGSDLPVQEISLQTVDVPTDPLTVTLNGSGATISALNLEPKEAVSLQVQPKSGGMSVLAALDFSSDSPNIQFSLNNGVTFASKVGPVLSDVSVLVKATAESLKNATITVKSRFPQKPPMISLPVVAAYALASPTIDPASVLIAEDETKMLQAILKNKNGDSIVRMVQWEIEAPGSQFATLMNADSPSASITGVRAGSATLKLKITDPLDPKNPKVLTVPVSVQSSVKKILVVGTTTLVTGKTERLKLRFTDKLGRSLEDQNVRQVTIDLNDEAQKIITARLDPEDTLGRTLLVQAQLPGTAIIDLSVKSENGQTITEQIIINVAAVAAFQPVRVALDIMDETTAGYLFGARTTKEFYVVRVRLFNNLNSSNDPELQGQSILAYSESIEAGVQLEKRYDFNSHSKKGKPHPKKDAAAAPVADTGPLGNFNFPPPEQNPSLDWDEVTEKDFTAEWIRSLNNPENFVYDSQYPQKHKTAPNPQDVKAQGESLTPIVMQPGDRTTIVLQPKDVNARKLDNKAIIWLSDQPDVAEVDHKLGVVRAKQPGRALITATFEDETYAVLVEVQETPGTVKPAVQVSSYLLPSLQISTRQSAGLLIQRNANGTLIGPIQNQGAASAMPSSFDLDNLKDPVQLLTRLRGGLPTAYGTLKAKLDDPIQKLIEAYSATTPDADYKKMLKGVVDRLNAMLIDTTTPGLFGTYGLSDELKTRLNAHSMTPVTGPDLISLNLRLLRELFPELQFRIQNTTVSQWKSSNPSVASVDKDSGLVTGRAPGSALITVVTSQGTYGITLIVGRRRFDELPPSTFLKDGKLEYLRHRFRYRPYSFEMMVNTVDERDRRTMRSATFRAIDAFTNFMTFLTFSSTSIRGNGDVDKILNGISNVLVPGFAKLYPDMKDTQRQNFVSMAMKPIEEIPFGSDVSRVLFFPKHSFRGMLPGHEVRISAIDTSYFNIQVAIIKKVNATNAAGGP